MLITNSLLYSDEIVSDEDTSDIFQSDTVFDTDGISFNIIRPLNNNLCNTYLIPFT